MSDANRVAIARVLETDITAVDPPTTGWAYTRYTSESMKNAVGSTASNELRSDRQTADLIQTDLRANGGFQGELSYSTYDDLLQSALQSGAWASPAEQTSTGSGVSVAANVVSRADGDWLEDGFRVGMFVRADGLTTTADDTDYVVVAVTEADLTLTGKTMSNQVTPNAATFTQLDEISNGTTLTYFAFEKDFQDLATEFHLLRAMAPDTLALTVAPSQILTVEFGFLGRSMTRGTTTKSTGATPSTQTSSDVMNAITNVAWTVLGDDGAVPPLVGLTNITGNLTNNLRERLQIGSLGAVSIGSGTVGLTGNITAFFGNTAGVPGTAMLDKLLAFDDAFFALKIQDAAGNVYGIAMPRIKFSDGEVLAGGINSDVLLSLEYQAIKSTDVGAKTIRIARIPA